jgi:RNA-directed DNA polymerase
MPEAYYDQVFIPKKKFGDFQRNDNNSIRMRLVCKPCYSLKTEQKKLNKHLNKFDLPDSIYGGVSARNNFLNALQHIDNKYFFKVDLKEFFARINNSQIHHALTNRGFSWGEARVITRIATFNSALPQGAPTSTTLANFVIAPMVTALEQFCSKNNITFTVFVDDITFSSPKPFKHHTGQILELIQRTKIAVNHKKISYRTRCCEITGIFINKGKLSLPKEIIKNSNKSGVKEYITNFNKQYSAYLESKSRP